MWLSGQREPEFGVEAIDRKFADIADRVANIIHVKPARPVQVVPLGLVLVLAVEYLDRWFSRSAT
jgi:hypothetical protein